MKLPLPTEIELVDWKTRCDQRIEDLLSRERRSGSLDAPSQRAKNILPLELCDAISRKNVFDFLSALEQLYSKGTLHITSIVYQVSCAGNTLLHLAANSGSREILNLMADHFPQLILKRNIKGDTALHVAARTQNASFIKIILDSYAKHSADKFYKVDEEALCRIKNEYGNTALHEAVMVSNVEGTELLFSADKMVTHTLNKEGKSPLYLTVETRNTLILNLLLEAPFCDTAEHEGNSPLHAALLGRNTDRRTWGGVSRPLIEGWLLNNPTPVRYYSERRHSEIRKLWPETRAGQIDNESDLLEELMFKRPDLRHRRDKKGGNPLHCAASIGHIEAVRMLLRGDPLVAQEWNTKGRLPIHEACREGHVDVVNEIVQQSWFVPAESLNHKAQNVLHIAAKSGKDKVVKYILQEKKLEGLLNEKDNNGNTPLHLASKHLHPKVLLLFTQDKRLDTKLLNNEGFTARDLILLQRKVRPTFRELLSFAILYSVGAPLSEKGRRSRRWHTQPPQMEWIKDRISTLLLVAILITTVTFAAGFTVPGGVNSSGDLDLGMATFLDRKMFQLFAICDVIAMYSSTIGSFILLWAQLGDFHIAFKATYFALYLVGLALVTMSIAFMAAVHLVVSNLSWLADVVMAIGIIFLLMFMVVYTILIFPLGARPPLLRRISCFILRMIIPLSGSDGKLPKKNKELVQKTKRDKEETQQNQVIR